MIAQRKQGRGKTIIRKDFNDFNCGLRDFCGEVICIVQSVAKWVWRNKCLLIIINAENQAVEQLNQSKYYRSVILLSAECCQTWIIFNIWCWVIGADEELHLNTLASKADPSLMIDR